MMKRLIILLLVLFSFNLYSQAQVVSTNDSVQTAKSTKKQRGKQPKQVEKVNTKKTEWYSTTVYMYAVSSEFGDTTVYMTDIVALDSIKLTKKYDYLAFRSDFSIQFKQYLADNYGKNLQTVAVFFDKDRKKLTKKYSKLLKRYNSEEENSLKIITQDQFVFKAPDYNLYLDSGL